MSRKGSKSNFPELKSMKRLSKIPVVQQSVSCLNNFYEKAKEHNVERIHGVMDIASSIAIGVALKAANVLGRPIKVVDSILDKSLSFVELKIPAVHDPPNKLHEGLKNYIYTFWGGEMAYTMVERLAATFRHVMEIIFISSLQENITLVRTMNAKSSSSVVKLIYSSLEVTLMTFGIIPEYLGKLFPSDSPDRSGEEKIPEHNNEDKKETFVNNEQNVSAISGSSTSRGNSKGAEKNNDSPNHSKQQ
ncbi:UNVERIFIED_CONTAM: hypothetical protein PYX00_009374 [Menopon gallinae]|uniref:Uncharacterized protein n=1 Tax=Menopon gallinae TaxID=328185 RepID=A0AAW2HBR1_9NEOP